MDQKYLTVTEARDYLRLSVVTIYRLIKQGRLRVYRPAKKLLFTVEDLDAFMKTGQKN